VSEQIAFNQVDFARRWGLHPKTLSRLTRAGVVRPSLRLGRLVRYRDEDLLAADLSARAKKLLDAALRRSEDR
jgi:hypothetical protein